MPLIVLSTVRIGSRSAMLGVVDLLVFKADINALLAE
jgi:hypothetical protein